MMNRRAFLKLFVGTVAVVAIPIPDFLLPKEPKLNEGWEGQAIDSSSGVLTQEMLEESMQRALDNYGKPDIIYMSKKQYKKFGKFFGYQITYRGNNINHVRN
jgi:hypothetical protein